jgi:putative ABC transport system substrate-binding protein
LPKKGRSAMWIARPGLEIAATPRRGYPGGFDGGQRSPRCSPNAWGPGRHRWGVRRGLAVVLLLVGVLAGCGKGGEPESVRVGILTNSTQNADTIASIISALGRGGLVEGSNLEIVYGGPIETDSLGTAAAALVEGGVDLILTVGTQPSLTAKAATGESGIPVVFGMGTDPVGVGLVASMTAPGGNVTGVMSAFFPGKVLEYLLVVKPQTRRVLVLSDPGDPSSLAGVDLIRSVAGPLGVELEVRDVSDAAEIGALMQGLPADVDAIMITQSATLTNNIGPLAAGAIRNGIPLVSGQLLTPQGALLSYGFRRDKLGEQMADLALLILVEGTQPEQVPVETTEPYLTLNLAAAEAIGLTIPGDAIRQAYEVYRELPPTDQG